MANNQDNNLEDIQGTSEEASRLLADLESSSKTSQSTSHEKKSESDYANQYRSSANKKQSLSSSKNIQSDSSTSQFGLLIGGAVVLGLIALVAVVSSSNTQLSNSGNSSSEYQSTTSGRIPSGKARYKSGRTGKTEIIGVDLSKRTNTNGHITYDAEWSDGYQSSYVFWGYGRAEIFSKNGAGNIERTNARYTISSNGDCVITAVTGAVTTFPRFNPSVN